MSKQPLISEEYRNLINFLASTPETITELARGLNEDDLKRPSAEQCWSFVEHVCHLRDIEKEGYSVRIQRIIDECDPILDEIDGDQLAMERDYRRQDFSEALAVFSTVRRSSVQFVASVSTEQLERTAKFGTAGSITLLDLLELIRTHDQEHLQQLRELRNLLSA